MATAVFLEDKGKYILTVSGHATGSPEVCAAVSAVVYALAGYLRNAAAYHFHGDPVVELDSGDARLRADGDLCVDAAFTMAYIGLAQIARKYPAYLEVKRG